MENQKQMKTAIIFPGQGAQFPGMGKELYASNNKAKDYFEIANDLLGFRISDIMFEGSAEDLKETKVTQPAIFIHSVVTFLMNEQLSPDVTAGHSLGEFSALVAAGALSYEDALILVSKRAAAMQKACENQVSTMAAILGLDNDLIEKICAGIKDEIVVPANYNAPGQLVISGSVAGIDAAIEQLTAAGARRALKLQVGGAFHSPLMAPAGEELQAAIESTQFLPPAHPIYQNVDALPHTDPDEIKQNLIKQLTAPVRWTQIVEKMLKDGVQQFIECGPGKVLSGLVKKVDRNLITLQLG